MAGQKNAKLKLLYMWKILREQTDAEHPMTAQGLCEELMKYEIDGEPIQMERKSVYTNVVILQEYGLGVETAYPKRRGYYYEDPLFEEPELVLMIDAIQSANFLTAKKSEEIIDKLLDQSMSRHRKESFQALVGYTANENKPEKNTSYYHLKTIFDAIADGKKIQIDYKRSTIEESDVKVHIISPYALLWMNDYYYLVGNISRFDDFTHFRLDRIQAVKILQEDLRPVQEYRPEFKNGFDVTVYRQQVYNGFSGEPDEVTLRCDDSLYGAIKDRYGDIHTISRDDGTFEVNVDVLVGDGFYRWVLQYGDEMEILGPPKCREKIIELISGTMAQYRDPSADA